MERISVLLVDDHALFRDGLVSLLSMQDDIEVAGVASDGLEALEKARDLVPDLILMDVKMPRCNGLEATRLIKEEMPHIRIV
ncbi:MAG: response regulator transcription factor, partial [Dehalococcoidia bacterium]|nr:response regulator transcription factor [Dehalococcoidia bacterium]